jgi:hypothetical protein
MLELHGFLPASRRFLLPSCKNPAEAQLARQLQSSATAVIFNTDDSGATTELNRTASRGTDRGLKKITRFKSAEALERQAP